MSQKARVTGFARFSVNTIIAVSFFGNLWATHREGCQKISFSNASISAAGFLWNFGDGSTFTGKKRLHKYRQGGTYRVTPVVSCRPGQESIKT